MDRFKETLNHVVDAIVAWKYKDRIQSVILFGSYARGEHGKNSDIDICIVISEPIIMRDYARFRVACQDEAYDAPEVDVKVVLEEHFEQPDCFYDNIKKDGIVLFERGKKREKVDIS